jgi:hypothetical protein
MKIAFHAEAEAELAEAVSYYEQRQPGLGQEFALAALSALSKVLSYPLAWPLMEQGIRRCLLNRFPYGIIYSPEPDAIFILAIMNLHRHPDYWKQRRQT